MLSKRRYEQIHRRVTKELAENRMWKHLVIERFWLCPYCGMVGASVDQVDQLPQYIITHLLKQCTNWSNFEGRYVNIKVLEARAIDVLAAHKLANDAGWKMFDEAGRWYCPYCAKGKAVEGLRSPDGMQKTKVVIIDHLRECHLYKSGRGIQIDSEKLKKSVLQENLISRLVPQIRRRVESDESWVVRLMDGTWMCPFCHSAVRDVDLSSPVTRVETAPKQMAAHLVRDCPVYEKLESPGGQPGHVLKPVSAELKQSLEKKMKKMAELEDDEGGFEKPGPPTGPLPAPKLSIFLGEEPKASGAEEEGFARGRVYAARLRDAGQESEKIEPPGVRRGSTGAYSLDDEATGRVEKMTPESAVPPGPPPPPSGPLEAGKEIAPIETITGKKRRALTGMMQRARIRLLSMLPDVPKQYGIDIATLYKPSPEFNGDFYYFHEPGPRQVGVALYTLSVKGADMVPLNELVLERLREASREAKDPKAVLVRVNAELGGVFARDDYATMLYGIVDAKDKTFRFANAGHCPPLVENSFRGKHGELLRSNGIVMGRDEGSMFQAILEPVTVNLQKRDMIILYGEGILETHGGPKNKEFGLKSLVDAAGEYSKQDAHFLVEMVETLFLEFLGERPQEKDLTMIALRLQ
ncbi:MAG: serine/threonine-protein phosphatase [Planctomycetes bacterium]|nr:serine/threonine-protein phosphatase [Planctomycetota bacterium]